MSAIEDKFAFQLDSLKIKYEREVMPVPGRRWRVDFLIGKWLVVEVEGGHWVNGRHNRGFGFDKDCEKYNAISNMGMRVLRVTSTHVKNGMALKWVDEALA